MYIFHSKLGTKILHDSTAVYAKCKKVIIENYLPVTPQLFHFFRTDNNTRSSIVWIYDRIYTTR